MTFSAYSAVRPVKDENQLFAKDGEFGTMCGDLTKGTPRVDSNRPSLGLNRGGPQ